MVIPFADWKVFKRCSQVRKASLAACSLYWSQPGAGTAARLGAAGVLVPTGLGSWAVRGCFTTATQSQTKSPHRQHPTGRVRGGGRWEKLHRSRHTAMVHSWQPRARSQKRVLRVTQPTGAVHWSEFLSPCAICSDVQYWNAQISILKPTSVWLRPAA